jgi:hypothetical protein
MPDSLGKEDARMARQAQAASTSPRGLGRLGAMAGRRFFWLIAAAVTIGASSAPAADLPAEPNPAPAPATTILAPPDATCLEWTDGCRTCQKRATETACSNIAIACQPQTPRCTRQPEK